MTFERPTEQFSRTYGSYPDLLAYAAEVWNLAYVLAHPEKDEKRTLFVPSWMQWRITQEQSNPELVKLSKDAREGLAWACENGSVRKLTHEHLLMVERLTSNEPSSGEEDRVVFPQDP